MNRREFGLSVVVAALGSLLSTPVQEEYLGRGFKSFIQKIPYVDVDVFVEGRGWESRVCNAKGLLKPGERLMPLDDDYCPHHIVVQAFSETNCYEVHYVTNKKDGYMPSIYRRTQVWRLCGGGDYWGREAFNEQNNRWL